MQEKDFVIFSTINWEPVGVKETIRAEKEGYLQLIAFENLKEFAEDNNLAIEINVMIGDYVYEEKPLLHVYSKDGQEYSLDNFYSIGTERSTEQNLTFALQKLEEVALRAISPGINDPNTANDIIIRIGRLLGKTSQLRTENFILTDKNRNELVFYRFPSFSSLMYHVFFQLSHYGREDISVLFSMVDALKITADMAPASQYQTIWEMQLYILEALDNQQLKSVDLQLLQEKVDSLAEKANQRTVLLHDLN